MLYSNAIHRAKRFLVGWLLCTDSVRILRVFGVVQYRLKGRDGVVRASNRYNLKRPLGRLWRSMDIGIGLFLKEVRSGRDLALNYSKSGILKFIKKIRFLRSAKCMQSNCADLIILNRSF